MNVKKTQVFYLSLIAIFITIISLSVYYLLGGFNDIRVYQSGPTDRVLFGKFFDNVHDKNFSTHGTQCRKLIEDGSINGKLAIMIYPNDTIKDTEIDRFVGIATESEMVQIPSDFEVRELTFKGRVVLEITDRHLLVQPRPDKVEEMIRKFALENQLKLAGYYLIYYGSDHSNTLVEWPIMEQ